MSLKKYGKPWKRNGSTKEQWDAKAPPGTLVRIVDGNGEAKTTTSRAIEDRHGALVWIGNRKERVRRLEIMPC